MTPEQKDEFVREWLTEDDPTGLTTRAEKPFKLEATEEPREPDLARETSDKE